MNLMRPAAMSLVQSQFVARHTPGRVIGMKHVLSHEHLSTLAGYLSAINKIGILRFFLLVLWDS